MKYIHQKRLFSIVMSLIAKFTKKVYKIVAFCRQVHLNVIKYVRNKKIVVRVFRIK